MYLANSFMSDEKKQASQKPLILVVEDHDDNLLLLSYALDSLGCKFICQTDSSNTLLVAKNYQPDLILLDILLPGLSGLDVMRSLKCEPLTWHIPVVAVTALAGRDQEERFLRAGFNDYISKPYMLQDLEVIIYRLLQGKIAPCSAFEVCQE
ncbi:response regulator [Anabaena sp. PCC 7108]|uniref:response regulator n=1 Tax=Anabaena sp. PCC 7108 TaxID=163908 RepID=UPI0004756F60|nr:response regulator [Anabaena sp. PCC 7108]